MVIKSYIPFSPYILPDSSDNRSFKESNPAKATQASITQRTASDGFSLNNHPCLPLSAPVCPCLPLSALVCPVCPYLVLSALIWSCLALSGLVWPCLLSSPCLLASSYPLQAHFYFTGNVLSFAEWISSFIYKGGEQVYSLNSE